VSANEGQGVSIPWERLDADTRQRLVEAFVTREGTDYGPGEFTLAQKSAQVLAQLQRGEAEIVFDVETEAFGIVPVRRSGRVSRAP
jgi:uncharacterized protein YheU (UPF0270 family)